MSRYSSKSVSESVTVQSVHCDCGESERPQPAPGPGPPRPRPRRRSPGGMPSPAGDLPPRARSPHQERNSVTAEIYPTRKRHATSKSPTRNQSRFKETFHWHLVLVTLCCREIRVYAAMILAP